MRDITQKLSHFFQGGEIEKNSGESGRIETENEIVSFLLHYFGAICCLECFLAVQPASSAARRGKDGSGEASVSESFCESQLSLIYQSNLNEEQFVLCLIVISRTY
ncbi:hypothetical protein KCN56_02435 [Photobacterium galatheae]|uniref:hypothetical protein n=1 Tax=Photobacterium galatheae TaxID=1654360 RepID=UPI00202CFB4B|nr:hypothetical protein [Photobacterium galatheae]MCM0147426.1 hypothetical protein [Photobacterium galatheae]